MFTISESSVQILALTFLVAVGLFVLWRASIQTSARVRLLEEQLEGLIAERAGSCPAPRPQGAAAVAAASTGGSDDAHGAHAHAHAYERHMEEVFGDEHRQDATDLDLGDLDVDLDLDDDGDSDRDGDGDGDGDGDIMGPIDVDIGTGEE